ncbi:MAG TPA: hypothetical protein VH186_27355, partial [Chloroflexia bacterium]|nr:hypothetical protein [Chloroflexia bacterium]
QIPESVETVLAKALAKKPVDRYESSAAFSEALQEAWHNRDAHSEPTRLVGLADTALEPTQQVTPVARPGSGPYNPEAEQLYAEGRRQEQLNNFYGAFDAFSRLDNRFPRYKDVPTILERYRVMGYGQNRPVSWQTVQPNPGVSGQYGTPGSFVNKQPSGQYSTPYNTHVPQTSTPYSFNQGTIAPARKNGLPVVPIIIGIVAVAVLAIVLIIVLAGGNKTSGDQSNQAFAATAVPTGTSTSSENATTEAATTESNTTVADTTEAVKPTPAITVVVPTRKPVAVTSQTPSTAKAGPEKYTSFSASDGSWSAEIPDSWDKSDDASGVSLTPKADPLTQIEVLSEDLGTATLSQDLVEGIVKSYLEGYGAKIDRQEKRKIDGIDATLYIGTFDSSGFKLDMRLATVAKGEKLYLLLFASLPNTANSSQREAVFDHLLNTINFK